MAPPCCHCELPPPCLRHTSLPGISVYNEYVSASSPIRVLVVARDGLTRAGLAALISEARELFLCGQTGDDDTLAAEVELFGPDVVLWDASPSLERLATSINLAIPVVAIVADGEGAALAWKAGVRGILARDVRPAKLAAAIEAVNEGLTAFEARFAETLASSDVALPPPLTDTLTERELQVLQLVAEGMPNKSIAARLRISEHTVKFHVNSILTKVGAQSRTQAVTLATRLGLIKL